MSGALDEVKQCAMRLPGLGPSGGTAVRGLSAECALQDTAEAGVAGAGGEGESGEGSWKVL